MIEPINANAAALSTTKLLTTESECIYEGDGVLINYSAVTDIVVFVDEQRVSSEEISNNLQNIVKGEKFTKVEGELMLAAEHEYGVFAKTVKNNPDVSEEDKKYILEQLKANFNGECSEVGMYLCMARIAHREGYPEIGLYWEKAAYEEAEHAAKFAELLGEELEPKMKATTKDNLAWRVDCEYGATQGKFDLAEKCDQYGLTAIEDTVREMARDEARHGKVLEGMLNRYFK